MLTLCAMAGFAVDVGAFYLGQRKQQAIADSAALAGAGDLPANTSAATADAQTYATRNGGSTASVTFSSKYLNDDTITVTASATIPTHFAGIVGIRSATVSATSVARAENLSSAWGSAPFGVINTQPELNDCGGPCFGQPTTLEVDTTGPGGFDLINIDGSQGGTSPDTLAQWIQYGCSCTTSTPVWLYGDPGAKFNSSQVQNAMNAMIGQNLLFPVYDSVQGEGANLQYHIIGFCGFNLTGFDLRGDSGTISGSFVKVDWKGDGTSNTSTYFGATTSRLLSDSNAP